MLPTAELGWIPRVQPGAVAERSWAGDSIYRRQRKRVKRHGPGRLYREMESLHGGRS